MGGLFSWFSAAKPGPPLMPATYDGDDDYYRAGGKRRAAARGAKKTLKTGRGRSGAAKSRH